MKVKIIKCKCPILTLVVIGHDLKGNCITMPRGIDEFNIRATGKNIQSFFINSALLPNNITDDRAVILDTLGTAKVYTTKGR